MSEVLLSLFENFDGNQDGYLNTNDIGRVLSKLSIPISDDEFRFSFSFSIYGYRSDDSIPFN